MAICEFGEMSKLAQLEDSKTRRRSQSSPAIRARESRTSAPAVQPEKPSGPKSELVREWIRRVLVPILLDEDEAAEARAEKPLDRD